MSVIYVEFSWDLLSSTMKLRPDTIIELEKTILNIAYDEIIIDFSGVKSMSIEFAKEYLSIKHRSKKAINEVNIPLDLEPTMNKAFRSI